MTRTTTKRILRNRNSLKESPEMTVGQKARREKALLSVRTTKIHQVRPPQVFPNGIGGSMRKKKTIEAKPQMRRSRSGTGAHRRGDRVYDLSPPPRPLLLGGWPPPEGLGLAARCCCSVLPGDR